MFLKQQRMRDPGKVHLLKFNHVSKHLGTPEINYKSKY